jgi:pyridoxal phosphate-dependent aminotransferase EpsN
VYSERLGSVPGLDFMPEAPDCRSTRWLSALTIDEEIAGFSSNQLLKCLEFHNIEARPVWKPLHLQPLFENAFYYPYMEEHSVSDQLFTKGVCLPSGSSLSDEDLVRIMDAIESCIQNR